MTVAEIFESASVKAKQVKYEDGRNSFEDIIKIEQKKKKMAKGDRKKRQLELQEKLQVPGAIGSADEALELADKQSLTVRELSRKDIRRLEKLKKRAESPIESKSDKAASSSGVKLTFANEQNDVAHIEREFERMEADKMFDVAPSQEEMQELDREQRQQAMDDKVKREAERSRPLTLEERMHRPQGKRNDGVRLKL